MENTNTMTGKPATEIVGVTETTEVLNRIVKVNNYNIADMVAKNWKFFVAGKKVNKKGAQEALDLGMHCVTAKWIKQQEEVELEGCGSVCRPSTLTDETFICGETKLNGKPWLCDDCLDKLQKEGKI